MSPRPALAGSLSLGFAWEWQKTNLGAGTAGLVFLTLPLERLGKPVLPRVAPAPLAELREGPPNAPVPTITPPNAPKSAAPRPPLVDSALARRLVRAALRVRGELLAGDRLDGLSARSRAAAALPELTLRAVRSTDESLRLSPSGTYVNDYTQTGGAGLLLEARATWKLDRLVFADEELRVERLRAQRERLADRVVTAVLKQLVTWQRARIHLLDPDLTPEEQLRLEVEQLEAESVLDVLTDGLFSSERKALDGSASAPAPARSPTPPAETPGAR
ncbi:MAG TPA: hypothetical protein VG937_28055 [Polyangiaceae bacterium]|nr:hypothetical protein [Polyangiaceae bacterium]